MTDGLAYRIESEVPRELAVGGGTVLLVHGWTAAPPDEKAWELEVALGESRATVPHSRDVRWDVPEEDRAGRVASGFFVSIPIPRALAGSTRRLQIALMGRSRRWALVDREIRFAGRLVEPLPISSRIAICLTTYKPDPALFRRQIESLKAQTFGDFTCIVQDDGSPAAALEEVERACAGDRRFIVLGADRNVGFYRNFERCLARVPDTVQAVALCDQDDFWYPQKLEKGLARLRGDVELVYSDMRLVDPQGRVLADSYWTHRRNNYRSLETLLLANTVTGAASLFRREVLDQALPFPPYVSSGFHDHWLAVVARLRGRIDYLDEPLYDYTQHGANVIGHADFAAVSTGDALAGHARKALGLLLRGGRVHKLLDILPLYYTEYRKLRVFQEVLALRFPALDEESRRAISWFTDRLQNGPELMVGAHLGVLRRGDTTNMAEFHMGAALLVHHTLGQWVPSLLEARARVLRLFGDPAR